MPSNPKLGFFWSERLNHQTCPELQGCGNQMYVIFGLEEICHQRLGKQFFRVGMFVDRLTMAYHMNYTHFESFSGLNPAFLSQGSWSEVLAESTAVTKVLRSELREWRSASCCVRTPTKHDRGGCGFDFLFWHKATISLLYLTFLFTFGIGLCMLWFSKHILEILGLDLMRCFRTSRSRAQDSASWALPGEKASWAEIFQQAPAESTQGFERLFDHLDEIGTLTKKCSWHVRHLCRWIFFTPLQMPNIWHPPGKDRHLIGSNVLEAAGSSGRTQIWARWVLRPRQVMRSGRCSCIAWLSGVCPSSLELWEESVSGKIWQESMICTTRIVVSSQSCCKKR